MGSTKLVSFILISLLNLLAINSQKMDYISKLVTEIIEKEQTPSILWIKSCWSKIEEVNFAKTSSFSVQALGAGSINLPVDEYMNKQWFFIDMNCERNANFFHKTHEKYFTHPFRWIIFNTSDDSIENLLFLSDSNVILVNYDIKENQFILKQGISLSNLLKNYFILILSFKFIN